MLAWEAMQSPLSVHFSVSLIGDSFFSNVWLLVLSEFQVYTYKPSRACLYWIVRLMKLVCVGLVLIAFFYCSYHIVLKYSVIYNLFLCYP